MCLCISSWIFVLCELNLFVFLVYSQYNEVFFHNKVLLFIRKKKKKNQSTFDKIFNCEDFPQNCGPYKKRNLAIRIDHGYVLSHLIMYYICKYFHTLCSC